MSNQEKAIAVVERLNQEYERAVDALRTALRAYPRTWNPARPADAVRRHVRLSRAAADLDDPEALPAKLAALVRPASAGPASTPPRSPSPTCSSDYLVEQLTLLMDDFEVEIEVGRSSQEIPFPYVLDAAST